MRRPRRRLRNLWLEEAARFHPGQTVYVELPLPLVDSASVGTVRLLRRNQVMIDGMGLMSGRWWPVSLVGETAEEAELLRAAVDETDQLVGYDPFWGRSETTRRSL